MEEGKNEQKTEHSSRLRNQVEGIPSNRKLKRELSSLYKKEIKGRKKRKMEKVDEVVEPIDRILDLTEPIVHIILSKLRCPSDVARISVWSKKWRSIRTSFLNLDFDQKKMGASGENHAKDFITSVETRLEEMHIIEKFKISLFQMDRDWNMRLSNWIGAAISKQVKELEIHVEAKQRKLYKLPSAGITSMLLTSLRLYGCIFNNRNNRMVFNLCKLKELSIKRSRLKASVIRSFIKSCPAIEDLRLVHLRCMGKGHLNISTLHKLRCLHLFKCHGLTSVNIESLTLVSFTYWGKDKWECKVMAKGCVNLKELTLKDPKLDNELFRELIAAFTNLEKLALRECNRLTRLSVLTAKLKQLSVIRCRNVVEANIDAPNLSVLEYSGESMPLSLGVIAGLHEVKLHICCKRHRGFIIGELLGLITRLKDNGDWKLVVTSNKKITIHEELREIQCLSSCDLRLELIKSPMKLKHYVDNLLRMSRPRNLTWVSSSSSELLKFVKEKIMSREENPRCCKFYSRKCWLHDIEDVKMVLLKRGAEIGTSQNLEHTKFEFYWQS